LTDAKFAFALKDYYGTGTSYLDLGFFDDAKMSDPADLLLFDSLAGDYWWTTYVEGIRFGDNVENSYSVTKAPAFTDSGTSCLIVNAEYHSWLIGELEDYSGVTLKEDVIRQSE